MGDHTYDLLPESDDASHEASGESWGALAPPQTHEVEVRVIDIDDVPSSDLVPLEEALARSASDLVDRAGLAELEDSSLEPLGLTDGEPRPLDPAEALAFLDSLLATSQGKSRRELHSSAALELVSSGGC
jgi:hypothetical protein